MVKEKIKFNKLAEFFRNKISERLSKNGKKIVISNNPGIPKEANNIFYFY